MGISIILLGVLAGGILLGTVMIVLVVWMQNRQENAAEDSAREDYETRRAPAGGSIDVDQILALMASGKKLEAIKVYRGATGAGLAEAKDAVEALERGQPVSALSQDRGEPAALDVQTDAQIRALLASGKKLEAIKVYRQATGVGLAEAKTAVETIERGAA